MKKTITLLIIASISIMLSNAQPILIGKTTYDIQSNGSAPNRLQVRSNGEIYAAFTGSLQSSPFNDRGTFLQKFDGSNWQTQPNTRLESIRAGFPALVVTTTGKQFNVSHDGANTALVVNTRATGTGSWTTSNLSLGGIWPRAVCSGGDTIHMICLSHQTGTNRYIKYFRSTNAGISWDINGVMLAGSDSIGGFNWNFGTEAYSIDAKGRTVAIVIGGQTNKLVLFKSFNGGNSFTTKLINSVPQPYIDGNSIVDTFNTTSNYQSVSVDNNATVHFFAGKMRIMDDNLIDPTLTLFNNNDLLYWNDNMLPNNLQTIASVSGFVRKYDYTYGVIGSLSSAYDYTNQKLYVVFEGNNVNNNVFKDLYIIQSINNGISFSKPIPITFDSQNGKNNMFPCIAKTNDNFLHLIWQKMNKQTTNTSGNPGFDTASIYYQKYSQADLQNIKIDSASRGYLCAGTSNSRSLYYSISGTPTSYNLGNQFIAEMSDSNGSFSNPTIIGQISSQSLSGTILANFPSSVIYGNKYFIRIRSTSPAFVSKDLFALYTRQGNKINIMPYAKDIQDNFKSIGLCNNDTLLLYSNIYDNIIEENQSKNFGTWYLNNVKINSYINGFDYHKLFILVNTQGTYKYIYDNGCVVDSASVFVPVNPKPNIPTLNSNDVLICEGGAVNLNCTNTQSGITYNWLSNNKTIANNSTSYTANTSGFYSLNAYSNPGNPGCFSSSNVVKLSVKTGINKQLQILNLSNILDTVYVNDIRTTADKTVWASIISNSTTNTLQVIKSINGGNSWTKHNIDGTEQWKTSMVFPLDSLTAWLAMYDQTGVNGGRVYKTTNGGLNWTLQSTGMFLGTAGFVNNVHFFNANDGVALGDYNGGSIEIYTTANGGNNWTRVGSPNLPSNIVGESGLVGTYEAKANTIWFITSQSRVFKSTDKGISWNAYNMPFFANGGIKFYNQQYGVAYGQDNFYTNSYLSQTFNGGVTWQTKNTKGILMAGYFNSIAFVPNKPNMLVSSGEYFNANSSSFTGMSLSVDSGATWNLIENQNLLWTGNISFMNENTAFIGGSRYRNPNVSGFVYKFTVDDISIKANKGTSICADDSITFNTSNTLQGLYNFQWQKDSIDILAGANTNTFSAKNTGIYRLKYSQPNTCTAYSNAISINQFSKPNTSIINGNANIFTNSTQTYNVTNTIGSSYNWFVNNGIINIGNGTNSISVTWGATSGVGSLKVIETNANGCKGDTISLAITIANNPDNLSLSTDTIYVLKAGNNNNISVTSNRSWTVNSNQSWATINPSSGNGNGTFTISSSPNTGAKRTAIVSATAGIIIKNIVVIQDASVGVNEMGAYSGISIYPNPTSGLVTISSTQAIANIDVYDVTGKLVYIHVNKDKQSSTELDLSSFKNGIYFIQAQTENGEISMSKVVLDK